MGSASSVVAGKQYAPDTPTELSVAPRGKEGLVQVARELATQHTSILRRIDVTSPMIITDAKDGMILHCNTGWEHMCGYRTAEVIGKTNSILQGPATDREEASRFTDALRSGQPKAEMLIYNYRKNGSGFWNHVRVQLITNPTGNVHLCFLRDMSNLSENLVRDRRERAL